MPNLSCVHFRARFAGFAAAVIFSGSALAAIAEGNNIRLMGDGNY
jgi:hypothetical protein